MVDLAELSRTEAVRWDSAVVHPDKVAMFKRAASRLADPSAKAIYMDIQARTGVPWFIVAVIHEREASQRWDRSIAQGDPWDAASTHVPRGRGPFKSFKDAAWDALVNCAPRAARWTDWSPGGAMVLLAEYNGLGYASKGLPTPYDWAGTNQYIKGKYVRDGVFDPEAVDQQLGCAGLLKAMQEIDPSVKFGAPTGGVTRVSPGKKTVPVAPAPAGPSVSHPAAGSIGDFIAKIFRALFSPHKI